MIGCDDPDSSRRARECLRSPCGHALDMPSRSGMAQVDDVELRVGSRARPRLRGQGCAAESQSHATIENGESPTSSGIALESPIGRESRSHLVVVALSRHEIAWLRTEKVQEGETLRRACGEARRKRNESCSRNRGPGSRRSYHLPLTKILTSQAGAEIDLGEGPRVDGALVEASRKQIADGETAGMG